MRLSRIALFVALATFGLTHQALATGLPVLGGLLCQLDATDAANITYDGSNNVTNWASSQGTATGFAIAPVAGRTGATYSAAGGGNNNLPCVTFALGSVLSQYAGPAEGTTPKTVFIMENTTDVNKYGGIWGRYNRDRGIRFNNDNPAEGSIFGGPAVVGTDLYANLGPVVAGGTHQLINGVSSTVDAIAYNPADPYSLNPYTPYRKSITTAFNDFGINDQGTGQGGAYTENYYWSDTAIADGRQTWQNRNWGTLGAYAYDLYPGPTYPSSGDRAIALGAYSSVDRGWAGSIGEVLIYDRWLSDTERQSVESYLAAKWLSGSSWPGYLPGDFNKDGEVGPEDFGILKDNFGIDGLPSGNHESWTLGDANDDGEIGPEDFGLLKDNFGLDGGPTGTYPLANVPEPTTLALLALGGLFAARKNRR